MSIYPDRSPLLAAALEYAALGWSVMSLCPADHVSVGRRHHQTCKSKGKCPFFPDRNTGQGEWKEFQTRRATEHEIQKWWETLPTLNLGVALGPVSGIVGIDIDDDRGEAKLLEISNGEVPRTWEFRTKRGRRLLYRLPPDAFVATETFKNETKGEIFAHVCRYADRLTAIDPQGWTNIQMGTGAVAVRLRTRPGPRDGFVVVLSPAKLHLDHRTEN